VFKQRNHVKTASFKVCVVVFSKLPGK